MISLEIPKESICCFLDESDFPKSIIVGGFFIAKNDLLQLDNEIVKIKKKYNLKESDIIKWNLDKGKPKEKEVIDKIGNRLDDLRIDMSSLVDKINLRIMIAMCWKGKRNLGTFTQSELFRWILQRLSRIMEIKKLQGEKFSYPFLDVIFDWLPDNKKYSIFEVYQKAYIEGFPEKAYPRLPLKHWNACPCLLISDTYYSLALQLADYFVGVSAKFLSWCFSKSPYKNKRYVEKFFKPIFKAFHKNEAGESVGYGLILPKPSRINIQDKLKELNLI